MCADALQPQPGGPGGTPLPVLFDPPELLPARMLNEFAYCPRLFYLEYVQGQFVDSADTIEGRFRHRRVDVEGGDLPGPPENAPAEVPVPAGGTEDKNGGSRQDAKSAKETTADDAAAASGLTPADDASKIQTPNSKIATEPAAAREDVIHARSLLLSAPHVGLIARIDALEGDGQTVTPVDYKRGEVPNIPERAWEPDRVQLCAQGLVLRENGYACAQGVVYYAASKTRVPVVFDEILVARTLALLNQARLAAAAGVLPPPLIDSPKCPRCSLVGICLPDEIHALQQEAAEESAAEALVPADEPPADDPPLPARERDGVRVAAEEAVAGATPPHIPAETGASSVDDAASAVKPRPVSAEVRRLLPARLDALPVYVQHQGATVGKTGEQLYIAAKDLPKQTLRLLDVSQLNLFGNVQISTQMTRELAGRGVPTCHFSYGGWFSAVTVGMTHKNVELRIRQFEMAAKPERALRLARAFIAAKVRNHRTLLMRNHKDRPETALEELKDLLPKIAQAGSAETLLGLEGNAARIYFSQFAGMLKPSGDAKSGLAFDFTHRNRRPPRDPVNALLSFAYSMLIKDLTVTLLSVGFDPFLGFFHRPRYGRPALALDMAEEFRPLIADSVVIQVINTGEVQPGDFLGRTAGCALKPHGRRKFLEAYERRLETLVTHPRFGYTISYRRIFEVQARLLAAHLQGELPEYAGFYTR